MLANIVFPGQPQWRSHEQAAATQVFDVVRNFNSASAPGFLEADVYRWFPPSENCDPSGYHWMQAQRDALAGMGKQHINDARFYLFVHDKICCFDFWTRNEVPTPHYFIWRPGSFHEAREIHSMDPPFLLRINNGVAGLGSWLVRDESEIPSMLAAVEELHGRMNGVTNGLLCSRFIDTRSDVPLNLSFRIIVAGNKIITGYARVSDPSDWVAVTNKFHAGIADAWLTCNKRCQKIMTEHHDEIVNAVRVLGLNHQGVDVIQDWKTGQLYFLEVQTTYDAGFIGAGPYVPPYYNPYNPELVRFIQQNAAEIEREMPLYYNLWLDKQAHFRACYQAIKESFKS